MEVNGNQVPGSVMRFTMIYVRPPRNGASTGDNDNFGIRHGKVGLKQAQPHIFWHGSGDEKPVGVSGGGYELDTKAPQVPPYGSENVGICFACIAPSRADLSQFQRSSEKTSNLFIRRL